MFYLSCWEATINKYVLNSGVSEQTALLDKVPKTHMSVKDILLK